MAKNLTQLVNIAEDQLIKTMSDLLVYQFENGVNVLEELGKSLKDEYIRIGEIVAEQVIPPKRTDIQQILKSDTKDIMEACELMIEKGAVTKEDLYGGSFHEAVKKGVAFVLVKYFIDYADNIKERMFIKTCEMVSSKFTNEQLSDKDFILGLMEENGHGWPLIISQNNLDKDAEVALKAYQNDEWILPYIDDELKEKIGNESPEKSLISIVESDKLNTQPKRKNRP